MQLKEMTYTALLSIVLSAGSTGMTLAQSINHSSGDAGLTLVAQQQTYLDVMANLEAAGYTVVETKTTLLGRVQITARNAEHLREVVVSRATGEVKSDVIVQTFATAGPDEGLPAVPGPTTSTENSGGILGLLGFGRNSTSAAASANVTGSASVGGNSVSGTVSSGVSGALGGSGKSSAGGSSSGSASGGGLGGGLGL